MENRVTGVGRGNRGAFTLIELIIVAAVVAFLLAMMLPGPSNVKKQSCADNLKTVGLAFRIFANDNNERLPWQISTNEGGSREFMEVPFSAFRHFRAMSNEVSTPRVAVCLDDRDRTPATNWTVAHDNSTLSYFAGLDASVANPSSFLSGDRFLASARAPTNGLLTLGPASSLWWTNSPHKFGGNLIKGDGSLQQLNSRSLLRLLRTNGLATNRLALPLLEP